MRVIRAGALAFGLASGAALFPTGPASALPLSPAAGGTGLAAQLAQVAPMVQVRHRGGGFAAGIIGGMILGGILGAQGPYYYHRPYYYYGYPPPYYYHPPYYYRPYVYRDPAVAYCLRRFKSYDPYSMTYLGYDGLRHPCP
jgi:BA14K-like protein